MFTCQVGLQANSFHMFKVNNRNTRARCEICSKLAIKITERRHLRLSGTFIVNSGHISHLIVVFLLLTFWVWFLDKQNSTV